MFETEPSQVPAPPRATLLVERWRPRTLREVVGQPDAVQRLRRFAESWLATPRPPKVRAALIEGAPGTGKTSAARALAEEYGWGLIEMSASDARNREALQQVAGRASLTNTFTEDGRYLSTAQGGRNLILLDDVDCIPGRGGPAEESKVRTPRTPPSFREFVKGRYREVKALNEAWGLKEGEEPGPYASFSDVPTTAPRGNLGKRRPVLQDIADWQPEVKRSDRTDRGGLAAVAELVRETRQPLVLTATDPRALSRASVVFRTGVARVRFYPLRDDVLRSHLHRVSVAERMGVPGTSIDTIARHVRGDLRAALNDLELAGTLHALKEQHVLPPGLEADQVLGWRDIQANLFEAVARILGSPRFWRTGEVLDGLDASPDDLLPWIEENLPHHARTPVELAEAFDMLARAQRHLGRANRWRIWTLWSYATEMMTGGVALALHPQGPPPASSVPPTEFPRFLAGMGGSRGQRQARDALCAKIGRYDHLSRRKAREAMLPLLERTFRESPSDVSVEKAETHHRELVHLARELTLDARDLAYLLQVEEDHASVRNLLHEERPAAPSSGDEEAEASTSKRRTSRRGQRTLF
ncbi:MAG: AAA family ATPase [Euryarchaeota archaeon]|nr:AAA family ATPase [Euryarchaeota archaeon]MDE2044326.1 AAA family ATPase [Thermoplasmata archaeon]